MQAFPAAMPHTATQSFAQPAAAAAIAPLAVNSTALLCGHKAVTIVHNGSLYRLQATRQGKLILTK